MAPAIFVCGATGTQGGAVARHLITSGATVHALARDPSSPKAKSLEALDGVRLWPGDYADEGALRSALAGTCAVFLNFSPDFADMGANLRQAQLIMRLGREAGATHFVYSSGVGMDRLDEFEFFDPSSTVGALLHSKLDIERAVANIGPGATYTILRPGNFMSNYVNPLAQYQVVGLAETGQWTSALQPGVELPLVDTLTIGEVSATALLDPERFHGVTLTYSDEILPIGDVIAKLAAATGRDLRMVPLSGEEIEAQKTTNPFIGGQLLMRSMSKFIDMDEVKKWGFSTRTFDEFLEREKEAVRATYIKG
ncbi:NmrA-like family domain-containing protein-like protein [Hapsidospora chrysogenum ATCC 11550]|uniref:NmrA-like family domain-containing protein-like protein n=1 Tax=Hapsidospora chrysogenum (strain ATCC 11550 / CBS 779.69 / DSM 880 / IAM 14645 / JCM 23072 / IMI 49137) TaxID=857340 RepID=A0A086T0K2_HAPC1|nr:NmrA-like family domain-containing protein-like protein [Hapsidospora chrysogenum ATCC 11550]